MPARENTPKRAGWPSTHSVSRLHPWIGRRESAGLFARSPVAHWRNGLAAGAKRIRTAGPTFKREKLFHRPFDAPGRTPYQEKSAPARGKPTAWALFSAG